MNETIIFCKTYKTHLTSFFIILSIFFVVLTVSGIVDIGKKIKEARYVGQNLSRNVFTVSETGEVQAKPDLAIINFSVVNEAKTATEATNQNAKLMNEVIDAMKVVGINERDLKTLTFNISPRYEYPETKDYYSGKRILAGYEATNQLEVKVRDMAKIGVIIETAMSSGSNQVSSLQMIIENQDSLKDQAREQAIAKVKEKADSMASGLGIKLGKVINFSENYHLPYESLGYAAKSMDSAAAPRIETGENNITVSVVVTYEIF